MAAQYSPQGHGNSPKRTIADYSLNSILGTGGDIATGRRKKWRDTTLIATNTKNKQMSKKRTYPSALVDRWPDHFPTGKTHHPACLVSRRRPPTAAKTSKGERREKPGRTVTIISLFAGKLSRYKRNASRIIRLILFRSTALPVFFVTLIPNRLNSKVLGVKIRENPFPCNRFPKLYTRLNSTFFLNRQTLGSLNRSVAIKRTTVFFLLPGDA